MYYNPDNSCWLSDAIGIFDEEQEDDDNDSLNGLDDSPTGISWIID